MAVKTLQNGNSQILVLAAIDFPFKNDEFVTFQDSTNEFRDPENIEKDTLDGKIRVFFRSVASPQ